MNYYNEFNPKAAAWLRQLISENLIPTGHVDSRSIADVSPADLRGYTQCHFFAGIAGWSLALQLAGWPQDRRVWTGSCPCQPFSVAGRGLAQADERHLWPVFHRLISECQPDFVFGEQVASAAVVGKAVRKVGGPTEVEHPVWIDGVRADLEGSGYAFGAAVLGAHSVGAPHLRQRCYWGAARLEYASSPGSASEILPVGARSASSGEREATLLGDGCVCSGLADARLLGQQYSPEQEWRSYNAGCSESRLLEHPEGVGRNERGAESSGRSTSGGCCDVGVGISNSAGRDEGKQITTSRGYRDPIISASRHGGAWSAFGLVYCRDGKARRIESASQSLADGLPEGVAGSGSPWAGSGEGISEEVRTQAFSDFWPLARGQRHRAGLLKGYGNAIVPQVAAEFVRAFFSVAGIAASDARTLR